MRLVPLSVVVLVVAVAMDARGELLAIGEGFTCVARDELRPQPHEVWCWGRNDKGQLATGDFVDRLRPTRVVLGVSHVGAGYDHACGLRGEGLVWCWGDNAFGQLGPPSTITPRSAFVVQVPLSRPATAIAIDGVHGCALDVDGAAWCWGLGYGTPRRIGPVGGPPAAFREIASGAFKTCAVDVNSDVWCWSNFDRTPRLSPPGWRNQWRDVAVGDQHVCAVNTGTHRTLCWGRNELGQLGDGTTVSRSAPDLLAAWYLTPRELVAGPHTTCAFARNGLPGGVDAADALRRVCWGSNAYGEMGMGFASDHEVVPVSDRSSSLWRHAVGARHGCGVTYGNAVVCWGANERGQLGDGTTNDSVVPVNVGL